MEGPSLSEDIRLAALRNLDVLNTPREAAYDEIAHVAAQIFGAPIALISLVEKDHQWFKACIGLTVDGTSRDVSFCSHAIAQNDLSTVFIIPDATEDPRFQNNPLVTGPPFIRFYAGAPLVTTQGQPIGSLCVIDIKPQRPTPGQLDALLVLGRSVVAQMELRRSAASLRESEERIRLIVDSSLDAVIIANSEMRIIDWNPRATALFRLDKATAQDQRVDRFLPLPDALLMGGVSGIRSCEIDVKRHDGSSFPAEISISPLQVREGWMYSMFVRDISARRTHEAELRESETRDVVLYAMARLVESRDPETGAHIERVQGYCRALAEQLANVGPYKHLCDAEFIQLMFTTSPLHDIGKIGIPDDILLKPGRLSDREFDIMKSHATIGAETLEAAMTRFPNTRFLRMARNIAATHHERWDGTGYPRGLKEEEIPLCGRIAALADVYDALTSRRIYKAAFTLDIARGIIVKESGKQFDPAIVTAFLAVESKFADLFQQLSEGVSVAAA